MRNYIPTLEECIKLVDENECFYSNFQVVNGVRVASFSYRLASYSDFLLPGALNLRGITYNADTGELLALPFWKFFNYGENPFTDADKVNEWKIFISTQKMDGSLVYFFKIGERIFSKTKFSIDSPQACMGMELVTDEIYGFIDGVLKEGMTPMFELIGPDNQIVLEYDENNLVFIGARHMKTGTYFGPDTFVLPSFIKEPEFYEWGSSEEIKEYCSNSNKMEEGFVVQYENEELVKFKTKKYFNMHHLVSSVNTESSIARLTLDEQIDDVISILPDGIKEHVGEVRDKVVRSYNHMMHSASKFYEDNGSLVQKEYALKAIDEFGKGKLVFSVAMNYKNGTIDETRVKERFVSQKLWSEGETNALLSKPLG